MRNVYADNAATSKKKPPEVIETMMSYMKEIGTSPGRGGYSLGLEADRIIFLTRKKITRLFNGVDEKNVFFSLNVTHALNAVIKGFLKKGDHVITSSMEHNAVARPLKALEDTGIISLTGIKCTKEGFFPVEKLKEAITPRTRMIIVTHASNVTGTILPVEEIGEIAQDKGIFYVVDCAQTAGVLPVDFKRIKADVLAFTGHKGLLGPTGTGGCYLSERAVEEISTTIYGGTGSKSDLTTHPDFMPDKFEGGTPNTVGIAGLGAALDWIEKRGIEKIREHEKNLTAKFLQGLEHFGDKITVYGPRDATKQTATVSINIAELDSGEASFILDRIYGIMTRSGLHCAPWAHQTISSFPAGTLRFSFGVFNTEEEVEYILNCIEDIIEERSS